MAARDPLLERALLETNLKLGPQGAALRDLLGQARGDYIRKRRVNASNAAGIIEAARQAEPKVSGVFDQALSNVDAIRGGAGAGGDPQAAAYARRVGESKANALADLVAQQTRAAEGRVYAGDVARDEYMGTKGKVLSQLTDLAGQQGMTTASIYGQLKDEQAKRGLTRRGQNITARGQDLSLKGREATAAETARHNRAMERTAAGKAGAVKWASQEQHASARDGIEAAIAQVKDRQAKGDTSRAEIIQLLTTGRPAVKHKVTSGPGAGQDVTLPAVPKLPADEVRAATNLVFDGSLSKGDVKRLHNRRLKVKTLGYPVRKRATAASLGDALAQLTTAVQGIPPVKVG